MSEDYNQNKSQELQYDSSKSMSQRKGSANRPVGPNKHKDYLGSRDSIIAVSKREDVLPDEDLGIVGSGEKPRDNQDI